MKATLVTFIICASCAATRADGLPIKNGRYVGPTLVLSLTAEQKHVIAHFRACHVEHFKTMNAYTPYIFQLTQPQEAVLKEKKGFSPKAFEVLETYRGDNDAGPFWNVALRFSESSIEIPLDLVLPDKEAEQAVAVQGWKAPNPCSPSIGAGGAQLSVPLDVPTAASRRQGRG